MEKDSVKEKERWTKVRIEEVRGKDIISTVLGDILRNTVKETAKI